MNGADLAVEREIVDRAHKAVHALCNGERWTMRVPAEPERDHDLVIASGLNVADRALAEIDALRKALGPEWYQPMHNSVASCPKCEGYYPDHESGCARAALNGAA